MQGQREYQLVLASATELEHVHEASEAATAAAQEVAGEYFLRGRPHGDVHGKTLTQEDLEFAADLVGILESGSTVGGDEEQRFQGLFVQVRWLLLDHFNCHDPK